LALLVVLCRNGEYISVHLVTGYVQLDAAMRNSSRYEGETLRIRCEITGFPLPGYIWLKDGRAISELPTAESSRFSAKTTPWGSRWVYAAKVTAIIIAHLSATIDCRTQKLVIASPKKSYIPVSRDSC